MKKKRSTRLINAGDILLTIICLIGMAVALYLFWADLNVSLSKQDEAPVAVVYFKKNTVQRRFVDRNLWERIQESAPVYDGDRIRTSDMSEAVTIFADGTEIEIHENSLIQIYKQKDRAAVDFVSGAITATAAGFEGDQSQAAPLLIKAGDKVVELDSGSAASVAAPVLSSTVKTAAVSSDEAGKKTVSAEKKPETVAVTVTKGTAAVREAKQEDTYKEKASAKSVTNAAQNSFTDFGATARQVIQSVSSAAVTATATEQLVAEQPAQKQVIQAGEVSVVKTVEPEPAGDNAPEPETAAVQEQEPEREATLYLPLSSTTIRLEKDVMPLIRLQWESNTDLTFEFARDVSFTKPLFTRTYPSYQSQSYVSFEDYTDQNSLFWRAYFAGDPDSIFATGVVLFQQPLEESAQEMVDRVLNDEETVPVKDEPDTQEEAIKAEAIRKEEEERRAREEAARLDAERARKAEEDRIAAEKAAAEKAAAEAEAARKAEEERIAAEKARIAAEKAAAEKAAAEKAAAEKAERERVQAERDAAEKALAERRLAAAKAAEEKKIAAEKAAKEKAAREEAERLAREEAERQQREEEARRAEEQKRYEEEQARLEAQRKVQEEAARLEAERVEREKRLEAEREAARLEAGRKAFAATSPTIRDPRPGKVLDDDFFETNRSLTFSWAPLADADSYRIIIKTKGLFSKTVVDKKISGNSYTLRTLSDLDEGDFEWSVSGRMADGTESKAASGTFSVKLEPLEDVKLDFSDLFHR